jgi:hypothetical protein
MSKPAISGTLTIRPPSFSSASACSSGVSVQGAVVVAAADGDAEDRHAGGARLVDQAVHIAAAKQFAEQDEDVTLAEQGRLRDVPQGFVFGHISRYYSKV